MEASAMTTSAPQRPSSVRMPGILRLGLVILALPQLVIGIWALISPRGWFDTFPGGGHHWLPAYGAYDPHLATDVGAAFLALGVVLVLAGVWLDRRLVQAALVGYLAYQVPHFVYHLANDHRLSAGDHVASNVSLGLSVALALVLLTLTRGPSLARAPGPEPRAR